MCDVDKKLDVDLLARVAQQPFDDFAGGDDIFISICGEDGDNRVTSSRVFKDIHLADDLEQFSRVIVVGTSHGILAIGEVLGLSGGLFAGGLRTAQVLIM